MRPTPAQRPTTVFFDGSCPLCRAEIEVYRRGDAEGALGLVDGSDADAALPGGLSRGEALARFHVMSANWRLISGAAAFAELWTRLPGWRSLGRLAALPGATTMLEAAYRVFLPLRPAIVGLFVAARQARAAARSSLRGARGP